MGRGRKMSDLYVTVIDDGLNLYCLVDRIDPGEGTQPLIQLGAVFFIVIIDCIIGKLITIVHLHDVDLRQKSFFQKPEFGVIFRIQHLIRICTVNILGRCLGKGIVPGIGKIACPCEIVDL